MNSPKSYIQIAEKFLVLAAAGTVPGLQLQVESSHCGGRQVLAA
jgi:hypothetical protein